MPVKRKCLYFITGIQSCGAVKGNGNLEWLFPLLVSYAPAGMAYGVLATAIHIPWYFTLMLSFVVYSGAVQSAFLGYWSIGIEPITMILTAFLLNLRHSIYGPHLEENFQTVERKDILLLGPLLTDEVYALGIGIRPMNMPRLRVIALVAYLTWTSCTLLGMIFTEGIPGLLLPALYLALPALFMALMVPRIRDKGPFVAAALSVSVSIIFRVDGLPAYFILVSILAGIVAGVIASPELRRSLK